jgi:hypothetical protein
MNTHLHLVRRLRINGVIPPLLLFAFMVLKGKALLLTLLIV